MKIVIITQDELFYLPEFIRRIAESRAGDMAGIVILDAKEPKSGWVGTLRMYREVYSTSDFLNLCCRFAAFKCMAALEKRISFSKFYSVSAVARRYGIDIIKTENINSYEFLARLRQIAPDVVLSVDSSQIFKKELLSLPPHGCINVHGALLPRNRGILPSFWVLANGEKEAGATVHFMDEKLDSGPIILQEKVEISLGDTQNSLILKTKKLGAELVLKAIDQIEAGAVQVMENDGSKATYNSFPGREAGQRFRRLGKRFF